jgi:phosphohistidine phosphatase
MGKTVLLLRHAAAENGPNDKKRPLTKEGRRQAESIGRWMSKNFVPVDAIFSSSAKRAVQTAELCAEAAGYEEAIQEYDALYDTDISTYMETLKDLENKIRSVIFVGHNPEISGVVKILAGEYVPMANSQLVCISLPIILWTDIQKNIGVLDWMKMPS